MIGLDSALELAGAGYRVFPIWGVRFDGSCQCPKAARCDRPGKHPHGQLVPHGLKDASDDETVVASWWRRCPTANVGVATGRSFFVLDVDTQAGAEALGRIYADCGVTADEMPAIVQTGGDGQHFWWGKDEDVHVRNQQALLYRGERCHGLDVRGDGGYVVVPPSLHHSGGAYAWVRGLEYVRAAPPALLQVVAGEVETPRPGRPVGSVPPPEPVVLDAGQVADVRAALAHVPANEDRTTWLERVVFPVHDWSGGSEEGFQLLHEWCARGEGLRTPTGNPAYRGEDDVRKVWRSCSKRHRNPKGIATLFDHASRHGYVQPAAATNGAAPIVAPLIPAGAGELAPWRDPEPLARLGTEYVRLDVDRAFPSELDWLRSYLSEIARLQQVPVEFPALLAIGAASGAYGNVYRIRFTGTGWVESSAIWALCAFETGGGKSPVFRHVSAPFREFEAAAREDDAETWRAWQAKIAVARAAHERAKRRASTSWKKAEDSPIHRDELDRAVATTQEELLRVEADEPPQSGVLGSDFTTEALVEFMERHRGRCLILDPEGSVFGYALDARNHAGLDPWLKSFTGEGIQQERVGRGRSGRWVPRPCLSMALCTQVGQLGMFSDERAKDKGFAWRFIPAVFRRELPERAVIFGTVPEHLSARWAAAVQGLLELEIPSSPHVIELGAANAQRLEQWLQAWLDRCRADPMSDAERVVAWDGPSAPKIRSYALRLALLLHVLSSTDPAARAPSSTVLDAVLDAWIPYLLESVERTMSLAQDDVDLRVARRVLAWIERRGTDSFSRSEIFRDLKSSGTGVANVSRVNDLNGSLGLLTDAGWIQPADRVRSRGPGVAPAASRFVVHPGFTGYYGIESAQD